MRGDEITFVCQLYEVKTKRDSGARIILDVGADALQAMIDLQKWNARGDINFAIAAVPYNHDKEPETE